MEMQEVTDLTEHPLTASWKRLNELHEFRENWNGNDVSAPVPDSITKAKQWIQVMYDETKRCNYEWHSPHITANEEGIVAFAWAKKPKRLSLFISKDEVWYMKAWGPNILEEMSDGVLTTSEEYLAVWKWLQE